MPARRDPSLIPLSHDHHHGLVRVFEIRRALRSGGDPGAERALTGEFYTSDLLPHFRAEEEALVPALRESGALSEALLARLLDEHRTLKSMGGELASGRGDLGAFADLLEKHIRFEERRVFVAYQARVPAQRRAEVEAAVRRTRGASKR